MEQILGWQTNRFFEKINNPKSQSMSLAKVDLSYKLSSEIQKIHS